MILAQRRPDAVTSWLLVRSRGATRPIGLVMTSMLLVEMPRTFGVAVRPLAAVGLPAMLGFGALATTMVVRAARGRELATPC